MEVCGGLSDVVEGETRDLGVKSGGGGEDWGAGRGEGEGMVVSGRGHIVAQSISLSLIVKTASEGVVGRAQLGVPSSAEKDRRGGSQE